MIARMSDDRLRYIEVIGGGPGAAGEGHEAQRAAFQAARRSAEVLAEEAGLRLTGVQQIAELPEEEVRSDRLRLRVRFGIEPAQSRSGLAGFQAAD